MRTLVRYLALLAFGIALGVALSEVALRHLPLLYVPMGVPNLSGYAAVIDKPGARHFHSTNRYGYRTLDVSPDEVGSRKVIAVIGDSHTNGVGVDDGDRFTERLQRSLDPEKKQLLVLNLGKPGSTFRDYLGYFEFAARYDPVLVYFVVYSGNDLLESFRGGSRSVQVEPDEYGPKTLLRRLYLYHLVVQVLRPAPPVTTMGAPPCEFRYSIDDYGAFQQQVAQSCEFLRSHAGAWREHIERETSAFLAELDKRHAITRVIVLPSKLLIEPEKAEAQVARVAGGWSLPVGDILSVSREAHDLILRILHRQKSCRAGDVCVRDLMVPLAEAARRKTLFFPKDWHLSPEGHAAFHDAMLEDIRGALQAGVKADLHLRAHTRQPN